MRALLPLLAVACYDPPDLPTTPWQAPVLSSSELGGLVACAPQREAIVSCTVDGDTLDLGACGLDAGERVRLLGIDAPETEKPGEEAQCFADAAAAELSRLVARQYVTLTFDRECVDAFQRTLAYLWLDLDDAEEVLEPFILEDLLESRTFDEDTLDPRILVNEVLLLQGFVRRFDEDWVEPLRWEAELIEAERLAQSRRNGLWSVCD